MREELVAGLSRDYGVHPYGKWRGAFWRLMSFVDLRVGPGHPGAVAAAHESLDWIASPRRLTTIHKRRIDGRVRRCATHDGLALHAALYVGLRDDPRLDTVAASLVETQWPDGWHYDVLVGLRTLDAAGALLDPRAGDALDLLEWKQRSDGTWRVAGKWWKRPGSKGSNVEVVDWGDAANQVLTEQAEGVLRAAGRL